jgi:hypothetical protein
MAQGNGKMAHKADRENHDESKDNLKSYWNSPLRGGITSPETTNCVSICSSIAHNNKSNRTAQNQSTS